ncbi:unnamed protein product, partial [Effrenium voratum]
MPTRLFTFGCGALGELGFERGDDVTCRSEATQVEFDLPKADVSCVALGNDHSLALVSGKIFRWGLLTARCKGSEGHASREEGLVMPLPAPLSEWSRDWPGLESSVVALNSRNSPRAPLERQPVFSPRRSFSVHGPLVSFFFR